jgi:hypothetical protein
VVPKKEGEEKIGYLGRQARWCICIRRGADKQLSCADTKQMAGRDRMETVQVDDEARCCDVECELQCNFHPC